MSDLWLALCRAFYTLPARQLWGRVLLCIGLLSSIWLLVAGVGLAWERYTLRRHLVQGGRAAGRVASSRSGCRGAIRAS